MVLRQNAEPGGECSTGHRSAVQAMGSSGVDVSRAVLQRNAGSEDAPQHHVEFCEVGHEVHQVLPS